MSDSVTTISTALEQRERCIPGVRNACSRAAAWSSLLVQTYDSAGEVEAFETPALPEHSIVIQLRGECDVESYKRGEWRRARYRPGIGGMTAPGNTACLRWRAPASLTTSLHIHIPPGFFASAVEIDRRPGAKARVQLSDTLAFQDPTVFHVGLALLNALNDGASDLYAESAAQFLASHLWCSQRRPGDRNPDRRSIGAIPDRRLKRVLEYMSANLGESLSLRQLANEAGASEFHFVRLFRKATGTTPHRYLVQLRLQAAAIQLRRTDDSVLAVALACGFSSGTHFAAAFRREFGETPRAYRQRLR
jgi:AraC family transcriptional regulator